MDVDTSLREWSQTAYGLLQAVWTMRATHLGNLSRLQENIASLDKAFNSSLGFESNVPEKAFRRDSIRLSDGTETEVFQQILESTIKFLWISLVVLFDECANELLPLRGHRPVRMPGGKGKQLQSLLPKNMLWAANGVLELIAIRNALVHGNGQWSDRSIKMLQDAGIAELPKKHSWVQPGIGDLFRYRRAVRTVLNEIKKLPRPGSSSSRPSPQF